MLDSSLEKVLKNINKKYSTTLNTESLVTLGAPTNSETRRLSLGSPTLDYMVYGSIPQGIFIEVAGAEASGKTTFGQILLASFIKDEKERRAELQKRKDAGETLEITPRSILYVDAEGTFNSTWAKHSAGYDADDPEVQTIYYPCYGQSLEQILDDIVATVSTGAIGIVLFDSLVAVAGQQTAEASLEKKDMGGIAKVLSDFVKRYTGLFTRYKTTFIGINGIYMDPSGYGNPEKIGGGMAWKRACSLRLKMKKGKPYDKDGNELKETENNAVGHIIQCALLKSKICVCDRRVGQCHLNYTRGLDIIEDTIEAAISLELIEEPSKGYFQVVDPDSGEVLTAKIHGKGNIRPFLEENPDIWRRLYDKVYEAMSKTETNNLKAFAEMLNITTAQINEMFGVDLAKEECM